VDSEGLTAPVDSEKVNKNRVGVDWEIIIETPSKSDAWIRKRSQTLLTQKKSTKTELEPTGKSSPKNLPEVTRGFESARSPCCLRKSDLTISKGIAWFR